jgi:hypothetical protein
MASEQGWRLVPIDPTEEMVRVYENQSGAFDSAQEMHAALLAAAPAAQGVDLGPIPEDLRWLLDNTPEDMTGVVSLGREQWKYARAAMLLGLIDSQNQQKGSGDV